MPEKTKAKINGKTLPHNLEAEQCLLGCILVDAENALEILSRLNEADFYTQTHRTIFSAMKEVVDSNKPVDFVTVSDEIEREGAMDLIGGISYLTSLNAMVPSSANYRYYLEIVQRDSTMRQLIGSCNTIIEQSYASDDKDKTLAEAEKMIYDIGSRAMSGTLTNLKDSVGGVLSKLDALHKDKNALKGVLSGLRDVDRVTNGFHEGDLVILAARPGVGKTSLAMNIVEHAAVKEGYTCAVFSLEMPKIQIAQRMLCSLGRVSMTAALHGELKPKDWNDLWKASDIISQSKIFVDDSSLTTPAEILSKCRRLKSRYGLDLVMIDYIQLMSSGKKSDNRQQEVSDITRNLKIIAKELGVPILALSQLSRGIESRTDKKPQLSDLRESGAIEQDADIVMFISKQTPAEADPADAQDVLLSIAKHRNGELADINLKWLGNIVRFVDSDDAHLKNALTKTYQQNKEAEARKKQPPAPSFAEETMPGSLEDLEKMMSDVPLPPPPLEETE